VVAAYTLSDNKLTIVTSKRTDISDISFSDKKTMHLNRGADKATLEELCLFLQESFENEIKVTKCNITTTLTKK